MNDTASPSDAGTVHALHRRWDLGQQHLAAGRYVAARHELETAEAIAWRTHDAGALARLYLPLLEARRQIRYNAAEGVIVISAAAVSPKDEQHLLDEFLSSEAGTILLACGADNARRTRSSNRREPLVCRFAGSVQYEAMRTGHALEALLLLTHGNESRLATQADPTFAAGLPVRFTDSDKDAVGASTDPHLVVPLPHPGGYSSGGSQPHLHALARESLITAWEALALKWQHRHPPPRTVGSTQAWEEIAWLRLALRVDPACEPIVMRLISLAEAIQRS